jgi:hypothetical protein
MNYNTTMVHHKETVYDVVIDNNKPNVSDKI